MENKKVIREKPGLVILLPAVIIMLSFSVSCSRGENDSDSKIAIEKAPEKEAHVEELPGEEPFVVVEEMPIFPGGDKELLKFISENTNYPEKAKTDGTQGRVIIRFCVTEKGAVDRVSIIKSVSPELDKESIRVIKSLPLFLPGKQKGKPVPVWYMVPITFALK